MPAESEKNEHGRKIAAGKLLSKYIREILNEEHDDPLIKARGEEAVMVTKAEAIARHVVKSALGYTEQEDVYVGGVKKGVKDVVHKPDKTFICLVWDRMEGRVVPMEIKPGGDKASAADKVSEQGKKRLDQIAKQSTK
jgi:hypothetical protein